MPSWAPSVDDANTLITPATPEILATAAVAAKTIPGVPAKLLTPYVAPKLITKRIPAQYTPEIPATYLFGQKITDRVAPKLITRAIPAGIIPAVPAIYADTRTGATIGVNSTGKIGLDFSYTIDSGSVDAMARFGATAQLPDTVRAGELFSIQTGSALTLGTLATQPPRVAASISQVVQMQGKIDAQICGLTLGCKTIRA